MKLLILVNKGLGMSPGKVAAQAVHAAIHLMMEDLAPVDHERWRDAIFQGDDRKVVVLGVEDEAELGYWAEQADTHSIPRGMIVCDAGATEIPPNSLTAVAIGPDLDVVFRSAGFDQLKLF